MIFVNSTVYTVLNGRINVNDNLEGCESDHSLFQSIIPAFCWVTKKTHDKFRVPGFHWAENKTGNCKI
jgi:hypothetical protein